MRSILSLDSVEMQIGALRSVIDGRGGADEPSPWGSLQSCGSGPELWSLPLLACGASLQ